MAETTTRKKPGRKPRASKEPVAETVSVAEEVISVPVQEQEAEQPQKTDEIEELKKLVRQLQDELAARKPQIVQVMADTERVVLRFQAEVADDNVTYFGPEGMYGQVTGKTGTIAVPKAEWSRFYNDSVRNMIYRRWLIVLSGMDDKDRMVYGCNYKEGEILDEIAFFKLLDMGRDLIAVFPKLCEDHQAMVASRFVTAYADGDDRAKDRDLIVALNEMSKETYKNADKKDPRRKGLFWPIINAMNAESEAGADE